MQIALPFSCVADGASGTDRDVLSVRFADARSRYDILRTAFLRPVGLTRRLQSIASDDGAVGAVSGVLAGADLDAVRAAELAAPLDLSGGCPIRLAVTDTHLVLTAAAAVVDDRSLRLLGNELLGGDPAEHEVLQFVDYSTWELEQLEDDSADARIARAYWSGALPADETDPSTTDPSSTDEYELPILEVRPIPVEHAGTLDPERWLAAWAGVLQRYAGPRFASPAHEHVVVALAVDGRTDDDLHDAIGPYERYVPLAVGHDRTATLDEVASRVRADVSAAQRFAIFAPAPNTEAAFAARSDDAVTPARGAFPLELTVVGSTATLWFAPTRVTEQHARQLVTALTLVLAAVSNDPTTLPAAIDVRGAEERAFLDRVLTGEGIAVPTGSITALLADHALRRPDALAVVHNEQSLTHAQLHRRAQAVATALRNTTAFGNTTASGNTTALGNTTAPIAILLDRSVDLIAAALGVLRTGAAYLPLDASNPPQRLTEQLTAAGVSTVVTDRSMAEAIPEGFAAVLLDDIGDNAADATPPAAQTGPDTVAYLIFTSGSTGLPKPVAVTHGNVLAYVDGLSRRLGLDASTRFATVTGLSTDLGNTAIFGALLNGGTVEIVASDVLADGPRLGDLIARHHVTALKITPSHLRALLAGGDVTLDLELLVIGGEALDPDLVAQARAAGVRRIVNHYGPTETTVGVFTHEVETPAPAVVPIGRPLPHVRAYVLDSGGTPVPLGAVGELVIGGPAVSAGYAGRPDATAERFVDEPGWPGRLRYRTGDQVRVGPNATVEFVGRTDAQVKIRGYRVELGEIEARLLNDESVTQAAAVVDGDVLKAYLVLSSPAADVAAIRRRLAEQVPAHLVPDTLIALPRLPLTSSGKLDRRALAEHIEDDAGAPVGRAPRNDVEAALVRIWSEVLAVAAIGIDDNFFQIGGHSLLATKVIARSRAEFAVDLPLHVIFSSPTVETMAAEIEKLRPVEDDDLAGLLDDLDSISDAEAARLLRVESSRAADDT